MNVVISLDAYDANFDFLHVSNIETENVVKLTIENKDGSGSIIVSLPQLRLALRKLAVS